MTDYLAYGLPPAGFAVFVFALMTAFVAIGYAVGLRRRHPATEDKTFGLIQSAIFATMAFLLGFTFSLAGQRFDSRREIVRDEANSIGTTALRATYLPAGASLLFRQTLKQYVQARLDSYNFAMGTSDYAQSLERSQNLGDRLWSIASAAGRAEPANVQLGWLTQSLNETLDLGNSQNIMQRTHVPESIFGLVLLVMITSGFSAGISLVGARRIDVTLTLTFLVLVTGVVFTIDDLDRPQNGLIRTDFSPIQEQMQTLSLTAR